MSCNGGNLMRRWTRRQVLKVAAGACAAFMPWARNYAQERRTEASHRDELVEYHQS